MKTKLFYTKYALRCFRLISLICTLLLICVEIGSLPVILKVKHIDFYELLTKIINMLAICFFIGTSIFPQKIGGLSCVAYLYAFSIIPAEPENYMGLLMYFLGTSLLIARGHLKKKQKKEVNYFRINTDIIVSNSFKIWIPNLHKLFFRYNWRHLGNKSLHLLYECLLCKHSCL